MFSIDDKQIKRYETDLKRFADRAFPFATRQTINSAAFTAQSKAKEIIRNEMTLRNKFTLSTIQVRPDKRELNVSRQAAYVGSTVDYMQDQEFGAQKRATGRYGVPIATSYAAGQSGNKRTRLPSRPNKMQEIRLSKRRGGRVANRMQANLMTVKHAAATGQRYVFLNLRRGEGIFRVLGGKKKPRIKMVWDLSRKSVVVPKQPWLAPAVAATNPFIPGIYEDALKFQMRRNRIFIG